MLATFYIPDEVLLDLNKTIRFFEDFFIKKALEQARGNKSEAAKILGLKRSCLVEKMRKLGMPLNPPRVKKIKEDHHVNPGCGF